MCCEIQGARGEFGDVEADGVCPCCGEETFDGFAMEVCGCSPVMCETCGWAPCDESC